MSDDRDKLHQQPGQHENPPGQNQPGQQRQGQPGQKQADEKQPSHGQKQEDDGKFNKERRAS